MKLFISLLCSVVAVFGKPVVTTTLAPYSYALETICADLCHVQVLIPEDANPHIYETKPQDMKKLALAKLWFCSGEALEKKVSDLGAKKIDLNQGLVLIHEHHDHHCCCGHNDLHTWMSPDNYRKQAELILKTLCQEFPEHEEAFKVNFKKLKSKLDALSTQVASFEPKAQTMLVAHAAYGYLCRDLTIKQVSLEYEGKEANLKSIQAIYDAHKNSSPSCVFAEVQHEDAGAHRLADLLKTKVVQVNPYQKNYPQAVTEVLEQLK